MFNLPSLPTDNLYKFLFLAGLVLLIYSFYVQDVYTKDVVSAHNSADSLKATALERARADSVYINRKLKDMKESTSSLDDDIAELQDLLNTNKTGTVRFKQLFNNVKKTQAELSVSRRTLDSLENMLGKSLVDTENEMTKHITKKVYSELKSKHDQIYFLIGLISFVLGALLWLIIIQLPQDELSRIQLKLARIELLKQTSSLNLPSSGTEVTEN